MDDITRDNLLLLRLRRCAGQAGTAQRSSIDGIQDMSALETDDALARLVGSGFAAMTEPGIFKLTPAGAAAADSLCSAMLDNLRNDGELLDLFTKLYRAANGDPSCVLDWRKLGEEIGLDFSVIGVLMMRLEHEGLLTIIPDDLTAILTDLGACTGERHIGRRTAAQPASHQALPPAVVDDPEFRASIAHAIFIAKIALGATAGIIAFYFLAPPAVHAWLKAQALFCRSGAETWLNAVEDSLAARQLNERGTFSLRALTPFEAGVHPDRLSAGRYGFTSASDLINDAHSSYFPTTALIATRSENRVFEVQKPGNMAFLAGYVDDKTVEKIKKNPRSAPLDITLYSEPLSSIKNPVVLPIKNTMLENAENISYVGGRYVVALHLVARNFSLNCECH